MHDIDSWSKYQALIDNTEKAFKDFTQEVYPKLTDAFGEKAGLYTWYMYSSVMEGYPISEMSSLVESLLRKPTEIDQPTLDELHTFVTRGKESKHPEVIRARQLLKDYFNTAETGKFLKLNSIHPILYGSLQFGDPKNMDADILLVQRFSQTSENTQGIMLRVNDELREI